MKQFINNRVNTINHYVCTDWKHLQTHIDSIGPSNYDKWYELSTIGLNSIIPTWFIKAYTDNLNWSIMSYVSDLSVSEYRVFQDRIDIRMYLSSNTKTITTEHVELFFNRADAIDLILSLNCEYDGLIPDSILDKWYGDINLEKLIMKHTLTESFLNNHPELLDNYSALLCTYQKLPIDYIKRYEEKLNWSILSRNINFGNYEAIPAAMWCKYKDKVDWEMIKIYYNKHGYNAYFIKHVPEYYINIFI
ncbi:MAG: hypothetical protein ACRDD8_10505 [Bacteroidales bacterium]